MPNQYTRTDPSVRFWPKVNRDGPTPPHRPELGPCWIWTGSRSPDGRGQFHFRGRTYFASIVSFILSHGDPSAERPFVLHACDGAKIGCVRPSHLFAGTAAENSADMVAKGRSQQGDTHITKRRPDTIQRGSAKPQAKLTEAIVREARLRHAAGEASIKQLAASANVTEGAMYAAVRRINWKHVH